MNKTWIFGSTSKFSKALIKNATNPYVFGRHNCDYMIPGEFIRQLKNSEHPLPNKIIINVNLDPPVANMHDIDIMGPVWAKHIKTLYFFTEILEYLRSIGLKINVCFITSTINIQQITNEQYKKWWTYIGMRQMQQSSMFSCDNDQLKIMGISPSKLSEENMDKYAEQIMHILDYPPQERRALFDLSDNLGWKETLPSDIKDK